MGQLEKGEKILSKAQTLLDEGGQIVLMSVAESVPSYIAIDMPVDFIEASAREAEIKLKELDGRLGTNAIIDVRIGSPAREIMEVAERHAADLIIIGSHRPGFANYLIGSTADRVVRHAACSVLVDR
jgi:nucleotide-binding universal stress UspA family protein